MNSSGSPSSKAWQFTITGAIAGIGSSLIFMVIHDIFISDIWFSWLIMTISGLICGSCVAWSYAKLFNDHSIRSWITYNLLYDVMFILLGIISILVFSPVTTIAALIAANEPPRELIIKALPLTVIFTLAMALIINQFYGRSWKLFFVILLTCTILVSLLGLNVSTIGLVSIPNSSLYLILELLGLIIAINFFYFLIFIFFKKKGLHHSQNDSISSI